MTDYGHELESLTDRPETDRGRALFQELLWVHEAIRRDLEIVEGLAGDVEEGMSTEDLVARLIKEIPLPEIPKFSA